MVNCDKCNAPDVFDRSEISNMEFKRGIKQGRVEGAKQELEIIRGFILFEKEKANWEDFYKFVEKRLTELKKEEKVKE